MTWINSQLYYDLIILCYLAKFHYLVTIYFIPIVNWMYRSEFTFTASVTRLGDLLDFGQVFNCPKSPTFLGNFCKVSKCIIFRVKSFSATFVPIWQFFSGHTVHSPDFVSMWLLCVVRSRYLGSMTLYRTYLAQSRLPKWVTNKLSRLFKYCNISKWETETLTHQVLSFVLVQNMAINDENKLSTRIVVRFLL